MQSNLPFNTIVGLPHPRSRDNRHQEMFLEPLDDNQTLNYESEDSNTIPLSSLSTLRSKGLNCSEIKW